MHSYFSELKNDPLPSLMTALVFLFPLGMATVNSWASSFFLVGVLLSLKVVRGKFNLPSGRCKILLWGLSIFFLAAVLSLVNADDMYQGLKRVGKLSGFLLLIPFYIGAVRLGKNLSRPFLLGVTLAGFAMAGVAFYTFEILGYPRAMGAYHPIVFGDLAMLCSLICLSGLVTGELQGRWKPLLLLSILGALYAAILSGTRGAFAALPLTGALYLWLYRSRLKQKQILVILLAGAMFIMATPVLFPDTIGAQVTRTYTSCVKFLKGEQKNTSLGQRFLMWDIAIDMWKENPILGSGLGDFRHDALDQMARGETDLKYDHGHAHNIIIESLGTTGLFGAVAMIVALFVLPFKEFYRHWNGVVGTTEAFAPLAGMTLLVVFFAFGLSEGWLARSVFIKSYLMCLLVFLAALPKGEGSVSR